MEEILIVCPTCGGYGCLLTHRSDASRWKKHSCPECGGHGWRHAQTWKGFVPNPETMNFIDEAEGELHEHG